MPDPTLPTSDVTFHLQDYLRDMEGRLVSAITETADLQRVANTKLADHESRLQTIEREFRVAKWVAGSSLTGLLGVAGGWLKSKLFG